MSHTEQKNVAIESRYVASIYKRPHAHEARLDPPQDDYTYDTPEAEK